MLAVLAAVGVIVPLRREANERAECLFERDEFDPKPIELTSRIVRGAPLLDDVVGGVDDARPETANLTAVAHVKTLPAARAGLKLPAEPSEVSIGGC